MGKELEHKLAESLALLKAGKPCWCVTPGRCSSTCLKVTEAMKEYILANPTRGSTSDQTFIQMMAKGWRFR